MRYLMLLLASLLAGGAVTLFIFATNIIRAVLRGFGSES
jgi:hypothetical protein